MSRSSIVVADFRESLSGIRVSMDIGHVIVLSGILFSLSLVARGLPPLRRTVVPLALFVSAVLVLAGFFCWVGREQARKAAVTSSWQTARAIVVRSGVDSTEPAQAGVYSIVYVFEFGGKNYSGNTLSLRPTAKTGENVRRLTAHFPVGREIKIYFDPGDPSQNVVWREGTAGAVRAFAIGGVLTALGLGVLLRQIVRFKTGQRCAAVAADER